MFGKNWKTSAGGVSAILAGLAGLLSLFKAGNFDTNAIMTAIGTIGGGIGLLMAKDHNVTGGDTAQTQLAKKDEAEIVPMPPSSVK